MNKSNGGFASEFKKLTKDENPSYAEVAVTVRRRLRRYSLNSIVNVGVRYLSKTYSDKREGLMAMPWLAALVLKLAIEDSLIYMEIGDDCTESDFLMCCNEIWNSKQNHDGSVQMILLGVRSLMHTQLIFQKPENIGFLRWSALISRLDAGHPSYHLFESVFEMSPEDFMVSTTMLMSQFIGKSSFQCLNLRNYMDLDERIVNPFVKVVDIFSKNLIELREILKRELKDRISNGEPARPASERNEFPWLAKYPILRLDEDHVHTWNPTIFFHGLEEAVHKRLSIHGQQYTDSFSKVFENYVIELIRESSVQPITDQDFKEIGNRAMPAVDALIPSKYGNVFIESKMSLFSDEVLISDRPAIVKSKLKRIREAMVQGWKVGELIRNGEVEIPEAKYAKNDFLIIVTSRQLLFGNGIHLQRWVDEDFFNRILPESGFLAPNSAQISSMPPQNIIILSIDEFEHLVGAVKSGDLTYLSFAKKYSEEVLDPNKSKLLGDQLIAESVDSFYVSELMHNARDMIENKLKSILQV